MSHLPANWALAPLSDIADVKLGKMLLRKAYEPSLVQLPYLRNENVRWGVVRTDDVRAMGFREAERERYSVRSGDLLVCEGGEPGRCAVYRGPSGQFMYQKALHRIRVPEGLVEPAFLQLAIDCAVRVRRSVARFAETTIAHLPLEKILDLELSLAPVAEQRRIVAEIDKHFTRLDTAVAALKRVQANLRRYRSAVLEAACTGRLLEPDTIQGAGPAGTKRDAETDGLPKRWRWAEMASIVADGPTNGLYLPESRYGQGTPILRIENFQNGWSHSSEELHRVSATGEETERYSLRQGELVINRVNSRSHLGKCLVVEGRHVPAVFESNMMRLRLSDAASPEFVALYLRSRTGKQRLTANAKWAVNQASINQKDVLDTPVPLPPIAGQKAIVAEVERRLSVVEELEAVVDHSLARAARLRQSILKRAFEGRLVAQDPNDEPASVLLERIQAERAAAAPRAPKRKPGRMAKPGSARRRKPTVEAG